MKVFLSGGTHGDWQEGVLKKFPMVTFFDPRTLAQETMRTIATTERVWLDECDLLFFYFETGNPSGLGSAFEVGYAVAKNIPVIFVDEKQTTHSEWLSIHCTEVFHNLQDGLQALADHIDGR